MKLNLICNRNVQNVQPNSTKSPSWPNRVLNFPSNRFSSFKSWMIEGNPKLRDSSNGTIVCEALLVVVVIATLVAVFLLFAIYIIFLFNLFLFVLPQPARTVECNWMPEGRATIMNKVRKAESKVHPFYELVERFVYADDLPPNLKENVSELIGGYKEEKNRHERLINEASKAKDDWYQAVYRAEGQRLDRLIEEAREKKENWMQAAVAEAPSELVKFGGSIPGEWGFAWKKIRQFLSRTIHLGFE